VRRSKTPDQQLILILFPTTEHESCIGATSVAMSGRTYQQLQVLQASAWRIIELVMHPKAIYLGGTFYIPTTEAIQIIYSSSTTWYCEC
jgi:hypothetical protein